MKQVLLFTDLGIDDAFTILYILFRNDIELVGIVANYGNVTREKAMWNINYLKYITGRKEIPVFLGASIPLTGIGIKTFPEVHGDGFGQSIVDLRAKPDPNFKMHGVAFQFDNELFKTDIINTFLKKRFN